MKPFLPFLFTAAFVAASAVADSTFQIQPAEDRINVTGEALDFAVKTKGYCTGIAAGSLVDKKTGFRDLGYGLDRVNAKGQIAPAWQVHFKLGQIF